MRPPTHLATAVAAVVVLTACGGSATPASAPSSTESSPTSTATDRAAGFPVTVASGDGVEVTLDAPPQRIVSLSPTATENLFAIGAGDQVVAVDNFSYFPEEAPVTDIAAFEPNVEAIADYDPDLVIVYFDANQIVASLRELDIPTIVQPGVNSLEEAWGQMLDLGRITGHAEAAETLVADLQADIEAIVESVPADESLTYYHELDDQYYTATSSTFIGELYGLFGLKNIADPHDPDGEAFGYPQLSAEVIIDADPDLIFLASGACCQQTAETVAARPGWSDLTAVQNGDITLLDDDVVSRWGPRIVLFVRSIATAVTAVGAESPAPTESEAA